MILAVVTVETVAEMMDTAEMVEFLGAEEGAVTQLVDKEMGPEEKYEYGLGRNK